MTENILQINKLCVDFPIKKNIFGKTITKLTAVDNVNFNVNRGEIVGIVGESGCGKSTLVKTLVGLIKPTSGSVIFDEKHEISKFKNSQWKLVRKDIQMIFQDPMASLNPAKKIYDILKEPLDLYYPSLSKKEAYDKILTTMYNVGLNESHLDKYSHEFSGGQCQRIGIARALICEPKLLICDEPVSALDVSIQAQVVNLIKSLQKNMNMSVIFIAHDLSVVKHISDRIVVMYLGNIVEVNTKKELFSRPKHPYTQALLNAIPIPNCDDDYFDKSLLEGDIPSPIDIPNGCPFRTRCPKSQDRCENEKPQIEDNVMCWYPNQN